jgi:hypothetical protein
MTMLAMYVSSVLELHAGHLVPQAYISPIPRKAVLELRKKL